MNQHRRLYLSLFILASFLLALLSLQNGTMRWIDAQMFRVASYLLPTPVQSNTLRVIQLDEASLQSPDGIKAFRQLLRKLRKASAAEIVWLSDDVPQMDYVSESIKKAAESDKAIPIEENTSWVPTKGERNKLAWMLEKQNVLLTQYLRLPVQNKNQAYSENLIFSRGWRSYVPSLFLPQYRVYHETQESLPYQIYPFSYQIVGTQPLIWYAENKKSSTPDLSLMVFSRFQKTQSLHWSEEGGVTLDQQKINTGLTGQVYPYFSALTRRHAQINFLNLNAAEKKPAEYYKNKIILIGQSPDQLQVLADSITSIDTGSIYFTPGYSWWLLPLIMLLMVIYLLWLLPVLSKQGGVFFGAFIALAIMSAQPVMLILNNMWWPSIHLLFFLMIGQVAVYIYLTGSRQLSELIQKQNDAWFQLGHYQYEKGDYESAISSLLKCKNNDEVSNDLYEIGLSFERKRQYDRALQIYSEINIRDKNYKDIGKRIKSMSGFSATRTEIVSPMQAQKTLVMPEIEMPEFGRYKIERELGRGAMGVVYLGNDPKINRKVAIKTLDYTQFSKTELKAVKSRFFREAEAAGRLSHNNIVTVYDVGEEADFAFIAMDYVEGVALSEFTQKDKLLPVKEVYRILQVVAQSLHYAHEQNIVHRDIKPGNIMYNPQSQQIKITDFGIARITDSVKTRTGSFMGSPSYMAPEQMTGSRVDGQADLYSLGVSMYQLLTGGLPFDADSLGNLAYKITNEKHIPIREVRPELPASATRITNKALQKKTEKRYASGKEMAQALAKGMP